MNGFTHIIEDSANTFHAVRTLADPNLAHCYYGIAVKKIKGGFAAKAGPAGRTPHLMRREMTRVVAAL